MGLLKGYEDLDFAEFTLPDRTIQWIPCRWCGKRFKVDPNHAVRRIIPEGEVEYFCQDCGAEFDVSLYPYHHGGLDA